MDETRITSLDWGRWYADRSTWPVDDQLFLAEAALAIAPMLIFPWSDDLPPAALLTPAPVLPSNLDAFRPDGSPREPIHSVWSPAVRAWLPVADHASASLRNADEGRWLAAHRPDPATGGMVFDPTLAGIREDEVSYDHWSDAVVEASVINEHRGAALKALPHLARAIAVMAMQGDIVTSARPIDGGAHVKLDAEAWKVDDPLARLASCSLDLAQPASVAAKPTHLIFVDPTGFDAAAWVHARNSPLSLVEEGILPADVGMVGPRPAAVWKALEDRAFRVMRAHLLAKPTAYHRPVLQMIVSQEVGKVGKSIFEKARQRLVAEFPFIQDGGPPAGR